MSTSYTANTASMRKKKEELLNHNKNFKGYLDDLKKDADILVKSWEGDASEAFKKAFDKDIENMYELYKAIGEYATQLESIIVGYEKNEKTVSGLFS